MPTVALVSNSAYGERLSRLRWAELLQARGYQVRYVLPEGDPDSVRHIESRGVPVDCYPLDRLAPGPVTGTRSITALSRIFSQRRVDIVHTFAHEPNLYGTTAASISSTPVIITQVTGLGRLFANESPRTGQTLAQRWLVSVYRLTMLFSTAVVFHNQDDARVLGYDGHPKAVSLPSGSGVDVDVFSPAQVSEAARAEVRRALDIPAEAVVITSVGRLVRHKGIRELLAAAGQITERFAQARFLIVGGADSGNRRSLEQAELEPAANTAIKLIGERDDVRQLLAASDVFVNPSLREGLPRASLEAMAMGKPVVALAVPGSRETVDQGVNGYLTPLGDTAALVRAIGSLLTDDARRARMGVASRRRAVERFRVELSVERIDALYRRCLAAIPTARAPVARMPW